MTESSLEDRLVDIVTEVDELRQASWDQAEEETLADIHARLIRIRQAQDRIEAILGRLIRIRSSARATARLRRDEMEDKLSETIRGSKAAEFTTAREREAGYELGCFEQKRIWRSAERTLAAVESAYDYVFNAHRGIDGARRDLDLRVRIMTIESRLER